MLDLKSKLLAAGLVTEEQVDKVKKEEEERRQRRKEARANRANDAGKKTERGAERSGPGRKGRPKGGKAGHKSAPQAADERVDAARWKRRLEQLQAAGKSEQYDAIRAWVQRSRIDAVKAIPTEEAQRFHFARHDTGIASLVLEPEIKTQIVGGDAAISAYMSHNGMAHCVVPRDVAMDIAAIRPEWVRVLDGYDVMPNQDDKKLESNAETSADAPAQAEEMPSETTAAGLLVPMETPETEGANEASAPTGVSASVDADAPSPQKESTENSAPDAT